MRKGQIKRIAGSRLVNKYASHRSNTSTGHYTSKKESERLSNLQVDHPNMNFFCGRRSIGAQSIRDESTIGPLFSASKQSVYDKVKLHDQDEVHSMI